VTLGRGDDEGEDAPRTKPILIAGTLEVSIGVLVGPRPSMLGHKRLCPARDQLSLSSLTEFPKKRV